MKVKAVVARSYREPLSLAGIELGPPYSDEIVARLIVSEPTREVGAEETVKS